MGHNLMVIVILIKGGSRLQLDHGPHICYHLQVFSSLYWQMIIGLLKK